MFHLASEVCKSGVREDKCTHTHMQSHTEKHTHIHQLKSFPCFRVECWPCRQALPHPQRPPSCSQTLPPSESTGHGPRGQTSQPPVSASHSTPRTHTALHSGQRSVLTPSTAPAAEVTLLNAQIVAAAHTLQGAQYNISNYFFPDCPPSTLSQG